MRLRIRDIRRLFAAVALFSASLPSTSRAGETDPQIADVSYNHAKNLARTNCGAQIDCIQWGGQALVGPEKENPAALLLDDCTFSTPLPLGRSVCILTLPRIALVGRFTFINHNALAEGDFEMAVSNGRLPPNDARWSRVQTVPFTGQRLLNLTDLSMEARYVRLTFDVRKAGRLGAIALYGTRTLENFAAHHVLRAQTEYTLGPIDHGTRAHGGLNFNFANQYAHGRVVYVSSGQLAAAQRMIDEDVLTTFHFDATDPHPTAIIAILGRQRFHRVSLAYQPQEGELEVYLLDRLMTNPDDFNGQKPVASVANQLTSGESSADFDSRDARYVALRWQSARPGQSFEVSEVHAFGAAPLIVSDMEDNSETFAAASTTKAGDSASDFGNTHGNWAGPPVIRPVSP